MAATDQTYRNQRALDIVFAASCFLMLVSVLWMFAQDYNREFKTVQRQFRDVEAARNERLMLEKLPTPEQVEEKRKAVADARREVDRVRAEVQPVQRELTAKKDLKDDEYRSIKEQYDSKMSYRDIAAEQEGRATDSTVKERLRKDVEARDTALRQLQARLTKAQEELDQIDAEYRRQVTDKLDEPEKVLGQAEDDLKKLTGPFDRFAKTTAQKTWKLGDAFRNLPILDAFASPTRINQITLPELTIDYGGFKDVPRYDRCTTCHLAIDRSTFDAPSLKALAEVPPDLRDNLQKAGVILSAEQKSGQNLGFDLGDLPSRQGWVPAIVGLSVFGVGLVLAGVLGGLRRSAGRGGGVLAAGLLVAVVAGGATAAWAPRQYEVQTVKLTPGQITQYAAHPRLDLFVGANSPHPAENFGCTACHAGQGSATDFPLAAHTPDNSAQQEEWAKEYGWHPNHDWDFPMLARRFVEASCVKCHHELTDLVRYGSKEEAPKLLRGYTLVKENGCFGCHEISGIKGGRQVGPDLRTEPAPALEYLSATEQDRARADPLNPPGTLRKVGPSLRRLSEKTNQEWTRRWLEAPREFRANTKMPHFYNLSTTHPDVLPDEQKAFPGTEVHAITHYLFEESSRHLKGQDSARVFLEARVKKLQDQLKTALLEEHDRKELLEVTRRLGDLALLSVPGNAREINDQVARLHNAQERLQELYQKQQDLKTRSEDLSEQEQKDLEDGKKELDQGLAALVEAGKPVPLADNRILLVDGTVVSVPPAPRDEKEREKSRQAGRELFTRRGCLACHTHQGAEVQSPAQFAPDLSRVAAKIRPEGGDEAARRRWLVQWVLNPNVHHPRTRMPVTHLTPEQAGNVADWLLSQDPKAEGWETPDPKQPSTGELVDLARVFLGRAPGMTREDVDIFLPSGPGPYPGIPADRLDAIRSKAPDADELRLEKVTDDNLKWYIGRKAIMRLGCYGCHDMPGFETAKPVGVALNDWGKKDPERLAFEDAEVYVRENYHIARTRNDKDDPSKPSADWRAVEVDGKVKPPYEQIFYEALEHHHREGFLNQKLVAPRSYDYNRVRAWDDRLRMPQFRFARGLKKKDGESDEEFRARQELEEAEARDAVMTFILGLVAEPMSLKYLNNPGPDRLAEVKGRQVLDKYNCAGCHQVRPGVYEFRPGDTTLKMLEKIHLAYVTGPSYPKDHVFMGHNAWVGAPPPAADRMLAYGAEPRVVTDEDNPDQKFLEIRLADALRFTGTDGVVRDLPAGSSPARIAGQDLISHDLAEIERDASSPERRSGAYGGTFTELMIPYLTSKQRETFKDDLIARSALPPPLHREGERVQPRWLHGFLLNPPPIRPESYMVLRMPKFNMSEEEASQLVNYFGGVSRLYNPGAGVTYPFLNIDQSDDRYWENRNREYLGDARRGLEEARQKVEALKKGKGAADQLKEAAEDLKGREKALADLEGRVKQFNARLKEEKDPARRRRLEARGVYAADAYRLLTHPELCLKCHSVGAQEVQGASGPNLDLAAERLRPEWTRQWTANPARLFTYSPVMPQNFPNDSVKYQDFFVGPPGQQVRAIRDVLMDLPQLSGMAGVRPGVPPPAPAEGGKQ
jgi:mono/diheme cytochrome c family protein